MFTAMLLAGLLTVCPANASAEVDTIGRYSQVNWDAVDGMAQFDADDESDDDDADDESYASWFMLGAQPTFAYRVTGPLAHHKPSIDEVWRPSQDLLYSLLQLRL